MTRIDAELGQRLLTAVGIPTIIVPETPGWTDWSLRGQRRWGSTWNTLDQVYDSLALVTA